MINRENIQYKQVIVQRGKYKIIHNIPILTKEEQEESDKEKLLKLYNLLKDFWTDYKLQSKQKVLTQ